MEEANAEFLFSDDHTKLQNAPASRIFFLCCLTHPQILVTEGNCQELNFALQSCYVLHLIHCFIAKNPNRNGLQNEKTLLE